MDGNDGDLGVGCGVVKLGGDALDLGGGLGREDMCVVADVAGGARQILNCLGIEGREANRKKPGKQKPGGARRGGRRTFIALNCTGKDHGQFHAGRHWHGNYYTGMAMTEKKALPIARIDHTEKKLFDAVLVDDYAWLRDKENPEVKAYLDAENAYAEEDTAALAGLRETLYKEMLSHIKQTDVSVPFRDGGWWYYSRTEEGLQYGVSCRKRGDEAGPTKDATEEVVLDANKLAEGLAFFAIGSTDITDDGRWLAYTTDTTGFRQYTLHIKDLETGETLPGTVERVGSVVWAADNRTLFYTVEDEEQKRQFRLYRHTRGEEHAGDVLVYQDDDERFNMGVGRTRDGKYLVMESASHIATSATCCVRMSRRAAFTLIAPREDDHEYSVDHAMGCGISAPTTRA